MKTRSVIVATLALVLIALPASAELYTIELSNGTVFESRMQPTDASWDDSMVMVLTDVGNWIGLARADVVSVTVETEREGFGKVIDNHTVAVGWAPNDAPVEDPAAALDPMSRMLNFLAAQEANRPDYSVDQFVEPGSAGQGGLPVGGYRGIGDTAFPIRDAGVGSSQPQVIDN